MAPAKKGNNVASATDGAAPAPAVGATTGGNSEAKPDPGKIARQIAADRKQDIYFYNAPISESYLGQCIQRATKRQHENALLMLVTTGGEANAAYRIARHFQTNYKRFTVFVPSYCKSAGTLLALGAHELMMTTFGEIGPLDVQLYKADELFERRSGLLGRSAMESLNEQAFELFSHLMIQTKARSQGRVRFRTAADLAAQMTSGLLTNIYGQIDPLGMGEDYRDLNVAVEYGKRLAEYSGNITEENIYRLVHEYPSHDFVIDFEETKKLFKRVEKAYKELYMLMLAIGIADAVQPKVGNDGIVRLLSEPEPQPPKTESQPASNETAAPSAEPATPEPSEPIGESNETAQRPSDADPAAGTRH